MLPKYNYENKVEQKWKLKYQFKTVSVIHVCLINYIFGFIIKDLRCQRRKWSGCMKENYWKNNVCTSPWEKARLHAGHLRCRVAIRESIHDLQNAREWVVNVSTLAKMQSHTMHALRYYSVPHVHLASGAFKYTLRREEVRQHGKKIGISQHEPCTCQPHSAAELRVYSS